MPSEHGHETYIAYSDLTSLGTIFVRLDGDSFQISESAGLSSGPVGEGSANPVKDGTELTLRFRFGFLPDQFFAVLATLSFLMSLYLFIEIDRSIAMVAAVFGIGFLGIYTQQVLACRRMMNTFSRYLGENLQWERT